MKAAVAITSAALAALLGLLLIATIVVTGIGQEERDSGSKGGLKAVPTAFQDPIMRAARACKHPELTPALLHQESGFNASRTLKSPDGARGPA